MSLLMGSSSDSHCVPCSPFLPRPTNSCHTPVQFVPNFEKTEQANLFQRNGSRINSGRLGSYSYIGIRRRTGVLSPFIGTAPFTPEVQVPSNTPRQRIKHFTPSAEQIVPLCSPYISPAQEQSFATLKQDSNAEKPANRQKRNNVKRRIRSFPQQQRGAVPIDLFSEEDIFA